MAGKGARPRAKAVDRTAAKAPGGTPSSAAQAARTAGSSATPTSPSCRRLRCCSARSSELLKARDLSLAQYNVLRILRGAGALGLGLWGGGGPADSARSRHDAPARSARTARPDRNGRATRTIAASSARASRRRAWPCSPNSTIRSTPCTSGSSATSATSACVGRHERAPGGSWQGGMTRFRCSNSRCNECRRQVYIGGRNERTESRGPIGGLLAASRRARSSCSSMHGWQKLAVYGHAGVTGMPWRRSAFRCPA